MMSAPNELQAEIVEETSGVEGRLEIVDCPLDKAHATNARCATAGEGGALNLPEIIERRIVMSMKKCISYAFYHFIRI